MAFTNQSKKTATFAYQFSNVLTTENEEIIVTENSDILVLEQGNKPTASYTNPSKQTGSFTNASKV